MKYKLRLPAVLLIVVLLASIGTISVQAAPACQRVVKRYVEKLVPAHYSKATVARWQLWNAAHPDYHPPKRRPHMTRKEVLDKVSFDCTVTPPAMAISQTNPLVPVTNPVPVEIATIATLDAPSVPVLPLPGQSLIVPEVPADDVPEPSTWTLLSTGSLALLAVVHVRRRKSGGSLASVGELSV